ncbi:hypothetical protein S7711_08176 [Stachybotrys chartarum IBT 7711]|uniref:Thioesterase domain-containing protein n=1 Tax=Stachybotrys chartarum (strain CBS 109288 / IBT 7711) TaxID=1280523 RepID=A0A084ANL7_STACB|nr:hypothetical protein S7711_08176 [Stachybotrys chartarum IBT 7711]
MAKKLSPTGFTKAVLRSFAADSGLEPRLLGNKVRDRFWWAERDRVLTVCKFRVVSASAGRVDFELDIHKDHTNRLRTLHGGTIASMVDLGGSLAVASMGHFKTGVSTDLNVTYLSPGGKPGDLLKGTATCDKSTLAEAPPPPNALPLVRANHLRAVGKTLAFTTVIFTNSKGQLAARGSHTKYIAGTMGEDGPYVAPSEFSDDLD